MRFELTTSTLARLRSTPELRPHLLTRPLTLSYTGVGRKKRDNILPATFCKDWVKQRHEILRDKSCYNPHEPGRTELPINQKLMCQQKFGINILS